MAAHARAKPGLQRLVPAKILRILHSASAEQRCGPASRPTCGHTSGRVRGALTGVWRSRNPRLWAQPRLGRHPPRAERGEGAKRGACELNSRGLAQPHTPAPAGQGEGTACPPAPAECGHFLPNPHPNWIHRVFQGCVNKAGAARRRAVGDRILFMWTRPPTNIARIVT